MPEKAHENRLQRIEKKVDWILTKLDRIINLELHNMATLQDVQAAVAAEDTVVDSAIALLQGLAAQVAALQPNQAAIDALAADITAKTSALSEAVVANTPAST
jgi:hypothetical protein